MSEETKKAKVFWQTILLYIAVFIISTLIFITLFHIPALNGLHVFFYRGCIFILVCSVIAFLLTMAAGKVFVSLGINWKDWLAVSLIFFGVTFGYFTVGPMVVERSFSVFMLSYMDENQNMENHEGVSSDELSDLISDLFFHEFGEMEKRFDEQLLSGNIEKIQDTNGTDTYVITPQGRFIVSVFRLLSRVFNMDPSIVYPNEYSGAT